MPKTKKTSGQDKKCTQVKLFLGDRQSPFALTWRFVGIYKI